MSCYTDPRDQRSSRASSTDRDRYGRTQKGHRSREQSPRTSRLRSDPHFAAHFSPRNAPPIRPTPTPCTTVLPTASRKPTVRRRYEYAPPRVEDEITGTATERGRLRLIDPFDYPELGPIDQLPAIQDLETRPCSVMSNDSGYFSGSTKSKKVGFTGETPAAETGLAKEKDSTQRHVPPQGSHGDPTPSTSEDLPFRQPGVARRPSLSSKRRATEDSRPNGRDSDATIRPAYFEAARSSSTKRQDSSARIGPEVRARADYADKRSSYSRSRPSSPARENTSRPTTPARTSPQAFDQSDYFGPPRTTSRSSTYTSALGSRPASPSYDYPAQGIRRASTLPVEKNADPRSTDSRSKRSSLLANSPMHISEMSSTAPPLRLPPTLPYPTGDDCVMPSEVTYHTPFLSKNDSTLQREPEHSKSSRKTSVEIPGSRPTLNKRQTASGPLPALQTGLANFQNAVNAASVKVTGPPITANFPNTKHDSPTTPRNTPTRCLQYQSSKDYQHWRVLKVKDSVNICPKCYDSRPVLRRCEQELAFSRRREADSRVKCCFTSKWYDLAAQLTERRGFRDLELLEDVATADNKLDPCPKSKEHTGTWSLLDMGGGAQSPFRVCPCDAEKLESLFPFLRGQLYNDKTPRKRKCVLGDRGRRFDRLAEVLLSVNEETWAKPTKAELATSRLNEMAAVFQVRPRCSGGDFVRDAQWHLAPQFPRFTICEECFGAVVWPETRNNPAARKWIDSTPRYIRDEFRLGHTCQLSSARMVRLFRTAVGDKNKGFEFLAQKVRSRVDDERDLMWKLNDILAKQRGLEKQQVREGQNRPIKDDLNQLGRKKRELLEDWEDFESC